MHLNFWKCNNGANNHELQLSKTGLLFALHRVLFHFCLHSSLTFKVTVKPQNIHNIISSN